MITLETLQAKRDVLVARRETLCVQIGMLDELIAEAETMERAATAAANRACGLYISPYVPSPLVGAVLDAIIAETYAPTPPPPPEMLPVVQEDAQRVCCNRVTTCVDCPYL